MFRWKKDLRIHIVIKDHVIRYVIAKPSDNNAPPHRYGEIFLPEGTIRDGVITRLIDFRDLISDFVDEFRLKRLPLYFCVPDSSVIIRHVSVPEELDEDEAKGYLYRNLGELIHLPFDMPVLDCVKIQPSGHEGNYLMVAYPQDKVDSYEGVFQKCHLKPEAGDLSCLSVYRLYEKLNPIEKYDRHLVVEWNVDSVSITAFQEGVPQFSRQLKSGLDLRLWKKGRKERLLSWAGEVQDLKNYVEDQLEELARVMNFYEFSIMKGQDSITEVILSGDWPYIHDLEDTIAGRINVPIHRISLEELLVPDHFADVMGLVCKK